MKKILRKYIARIVFLASFIIIIGASVISVQQTKRNQIEYFDILIRQIEGTIEDKGIWMATMEQEEIKPLVQQIFNGIPTTEDLTLFLVDKESGDILGITKNNDAEMKIQTTASMVDELEQCSNGKILTINEEKRFVYARSYQGNLIGAYLDLNTIYQMVIGSMIIAIIIILFISICITYLVGRVVDKYVIQDINAILEGLSQVLNGNFNVKFEGKYPTELSKIADGLNQYVNSYGSHSERLNAVFQLIDKDLATFEYLRDINHLFFSQNITELLGLDQELWKALVDSPNLFELYIECLQPLEKYKNVYITKDNRYIEIKKYTTKNAYCGLIQDVTEEIKERNQMLNDLQIANINANTDGLTGLKNAQCAKKEIQDILDTQTVSGFFCIFDLDNFKRVNDKAGHPEGDRLLQKFADCLREYFKEKGLLARLGGDEFIVLVIGDYGKREIEEQIEHMLQYVKEQLIDYYMKFQLSVSVGVVPLTQEIKTFEEIYEYADSALYVAKRHGKDGFYMNEDNLTCKKNECENCKKDCSRKETLGLD